ncbi:pseudouridine synthase [Candidatus Bipolaricaulota bacterium]|nr:pseudouridine synthase [Candidatus Bipolaricaulota bacterium]
MFLLIQRHAGVSRRKAQELVLAGEVALNDTIVVDPFLRINPGTAVSLSLRGHPISLQSPELRIYRYHKPKGMLCSHDDPHEGNTVGRILRSEGLIGYSWAGRLDQDSEGLLLVTNDGTLLNHLSHPRYEVTKSYNVWLDRLPHRAELDGMLREMKQGIHDEGDLLRILSGKMAGSPPHIFIQLTEGKKREIKRLFAHFDLAVVRLLRLSIGPVELGDLRPGSLERMSVAQIKSLRQFIQETLPSEPSEQFLQD